MTGIRRAPLLLLSGALALVSVARAQEPPPEVSPVQRVLERLRVARLVRTRGAYVLALRLEAGAQPGLEAHAGLYGANTQIQELPGPAGVWHVRVANHEDRALLVTAGEALLTSQGPSRATDRPVWIPAHAATFVPVVQTSDPPPPGPYLTRGRGLTPVEQSLLDLGQLAARIRLRNRTLGVAEGRLEDAAAGYTTPLFQERVETYRRLLAPLADGREVVGVMVVGERGPHFAHLELDAPRFAERWPALLEGIAIDAFLVEDTDLSPSPSDETELRNLVRELLRPLADLPLSRPNFGRGREVLWPLEGEDGSWQGLVLEEGPVSLTLHRRPPPLPGGVRGGPPSGPGGSPGDDGAPEGATELERRRRPTPFEERLRERRDRPQGPVPPSPPPPGPTPRAPSPGPTPGTLPAPLPPGPIAPPRGPLDPSPPTGGARPPLR